MSATEPAEEVTTESDHPSVTMTMNEATEVYVAGLPDDYNVSVRIVFNPCRPTATVELFVSIFHSFEAGIANAISSFK